MRYFFHSTKGEIFTDNEGEELVDDLAARREAVLLFAALLLDHSDAFWADGRFSVKVMEADGRVVAEVTASPGGSPSTPH
ncbi:DUF6894 family protein [Brevundimonas sp. TWP1-2-1b1]|uniref:DUF6894 family protein n=1 Tax=unclassified Brevundimonas TaxID=2622653 RepID=UPI003CEADABB